jgi:hypothetical protein
MNRLTLLVILMLALSTAAGAEKTRKVSDVSVEHVAPLNPTPTSLFAELKRE